METDIVKHIKIIIYEVYVCKNYLILLAQLTKIYPPTPHIFP
jgi:hypothetical protein